jgi:starch phosphorylase
MKFALNGALTIGTMDGANIEMCEEIGEENMFIFGLRAQEVDELKANGYVAYDYFKKSDALRKVIDLINLDFFNQETPSQFKPLVDSLLNNDRYMICADFDLYCAAHRQVRNVYHEQARWTEMSIRNVANMGKFSSDRTIQEYSSEIWHTKPVPIHLDR